MNIETLEQKIRDGEIDTVAIVFPDVYGRLTGKRFNGAFFLDAVREHGTHVCNYLITLNIELDPWADFRVANWEKGFGDFSLLPDWSTLRVLPWLEKTALVIGSLHHQDGAPVAETPRSVLQRQVDRLKERGYECLAASELEFFLYHCDYPAAAAANYTDLPASSGYRIDYQIAQPGRDEDILRPLRNLMPEAGIPVEGSKGEWGKGQHEVNFQYAEVLAMADRHVVFKQGAREIAQARGKSMTFMAKPFADEVGSSCHIHMSLAGAGNNLFWDEGARTGSALFRAFLGGLLKYSRELSCFFAPTINSYKRYQALSWAPTKLVWSFDNRTTGFRVVGHGGGFRLENRMPGADVNVYLAFAAMIAAGLAGVDEGLDCGAPYDGNAYTDAKLIGLPGTLSEAAHLLQESAMAKSAFGENVVDFYALTARHECDEFHAAVTDWERRRYFEQI